MATRRTCSSSTTFAARSQSSTATSARLSASSAGVRDKLKFNEALKRMLNHLVTDLIENTRRRLQASGVSDRRRHPAPSRASRRLQSRHRCGARPGQAVPLSEPLPQRIAAPAEGRRGKDRQRPFRLLDRAPRPACRISYQQQMETETPGSRDLRLHRRHDRQLHPGSAPKSNGLSRCGVDALHGLALEFVVSNPVIPTLQPHSYRSRPPLSNFISH